MGRLSVDSEGSSVYESMRNSSQGLRFSASHQVARNCRRSDTDKYRVIETHLVESDTGLKTALNLIRFDYSKEHSLHRQWWPPVSVGGTAEPVHYGEHSPDVIYTLLVSLPYILSLMELSSAHQKNAPIQVANSSVSVKLAL